ncbi:hypothetical protein PBPRA1255 [Photobacterium profundum SS9]|uniref:Uncharacterized protein n=1 Tax=Photobacterium profundum (strain SS9) TaxID=298386 RepID=Q6LSR0_PHOPR|nr:hypothetical protein PBPRA1255 [Photobacterium profundum SS9]
MRSRILRDKPSAVKHPPPSGWHKNSRNVVIVYWLAIPKSKPKCQGSHQTLLSSSKIHPLSQFLLLKPMALSVCQLRFLSGMSLAFQLTRIW